VNIAKLPELSLAESELLKSVSLFPTLAMAACEQGRRITPGGLTVFGRARRTSGQGAAF
jgi:hypothetical protein